MPSKAALGAERRPAAAGPSRCARWAQPARRRPALHLVLWLAALAALAPGFPGRAGVAQTAPAPFTPEYLRDPRNIEQGREIWRARCQFCHGRAAYPGKAPRLDPSRYTPEFVYDRVTNGFRGMPGWRTEFSEAQLRAVVAYVLSRDFSN